MTSAAAIATTTPPNHYVYTNNWFDMSAKSVWDALVLQYKPARVLEIGSYEGKSACYLIEHLGKQQPLEIHCVDSWEGGEEHQKKGEDMSSVEARFNHNTQLAISQASFPVKLVTHKKFSDRALYSLLAEGKEGYFDFVYVDGSHQAPDVLCDAVLGFRLLKVGGIMGFDDYIGAEEFSYGKDLFLCPKMAIDSFVNAYFRKVTLYNAPLYQLYLAKNTN